MSARLSVDRAALRANLEQIRATVAPATHVLVVKDDAYGHGLLPVVQAAAACGVEWFGTFDVATAVAVRAAVGPEPHIVAWTVYDDTDVDAAIHADIDLGLGTVALIDAVAARAAAHGVRLRVHIKADTGLHRNGVRPERWAEAVDRAHVAEDAGFLSVVALWSHIAEASDDEDDAARAAFLRAAHAWGEPAPLLHLAASAAAFARPEFRFDLVRIGAFAYGIRPAGGPAESKLGVTPIATVYATVTDVGADAVRVDMGWLDGLDSRLAGRLSVRTPAGMRRIRAIGPGHTTIDRWPSAAAGQDVAIFGGQAAYTATDVAEMLGTIGEEVMLRISPHLERVYSD